MSAAVDITEEVVGLGPRGLAATLGELEVERRRVEARIVEVLIEAARTSAYGEDGHTNVGSWARATTGWSRAESMARVRTSRMVLDLPQLRRESLAGTVGVAQTHELARAHSNPRCRDQLPASEEILVGAAKDLWFDEFRTVVQRWESLADADGAAQSQADAHDGRNAHLSPVGCAVRLDASGGSAQGASMIEIFEQFVAAEFDADRQAAGAGSPLGRTSAQRRFDALYSIFMKAATGETAGSSPTPLVNIMVDLATFEAQLARLSGTDMPPADPSTVMSRRCETVAGIPLDPADVVTAALIGRVRRIVFDTSGRVIDLGRRSRLFVGAAREAVLMSDRTCFWPGCDVAAARCEVDHTIPWASGQGATRPGNGGTGCDRHNRWKQRGYRTHRDPNGTWHTIRPDGTEILRV